MIGRKALPRRTLLRGLGAGIALPLLDAMTPALAKTARRRPPVRLAVLYVANGVHMADWTPRGRGGDVELPAVLPPILTPLAKHRRDLLVLSGFAQDNAAPLGDGGGDHARALATFLTGVHPLKTAGANIRAGVSADQLAAQKIGHLTRLPSLELGLERGAQSGACDSGYSCAYSSNIAWKTESLPLAKEVDPAIVFERLFGRGADPRRSWEKASLLDFVKGELDALVPQLGPTDRRKLDEYLTGLRELEGRIARFGKLPPVEAPPFSAPEEPPKDYGEHARLMHDLTILAFRADVTRIVTLMMTNDLSNRSYPQLEISEGHHNLSHHGHDPEKLEKIARINTYHMTLLASLLDKMKAVEEGAGSLLDASMVLWGSGISDGDKHNHDDLPILLAGRAGGTIRPGRHLAVGKLPLNNLLLAMLDRLGAPVERFGDSTGHFGGLGAPA
jgi:hypothetical protein